MLIKALWQVITLTVWEKLYMWCGFIIAEQN